MSGRPLASFYKYGISLVNFPVLGKSWDNTPIAVQPVIDHWIPGVVPAAEEMTYILKTATGTAADLMTFCGFLDGLNWPSGLQTLTLSGSAVRFPAWDPFRARLMRINSPGGVSKLYRYYSILSDANAEVFTGSNALTYPGHCVIVKPSDGGVFTVESTTKIAYMAGGTNTWVENTGPAMPTPGVTDGVYFAGKFVWWDVNTTTTQAWYSTDGLSYSAATAPGGGFPAGTGTGFPAPSATNGTILCMFPILGGASNAYVTTTDGITWTTQNFVLNTSEIVVGAGYSAPEGLFYVCTSPGPTSSFVPGTSRIWTSATGLSGSWTAVGSLAYQIVSFAVSGTELCAVTLIYAATDGVGETGRIVLSGDRGVTWGFARVGTVSPLTAVRSYPNGFYVIDATNQVAGVSLATGAPQLVV